MKIVQRSVEQNKAFRFRYKREFNKITSAMRYYTTYIEENCNIYHRFEPVNINKAIIGAIENTETITKSNDNVNQYSVRTNNKIMGITIDSIIEKEEKTDAIQTEEICFSKIENLSYTKPTYTSYFEEEIENTYSWKQLYVGVFKKIYDDYDTNIPLNKSFTSINGRIDFSTSEHCSSMIAPKEITQGRYLETNLSATDIIRKIKALLDICLVDYENVVIKYINTTSNHDCTNNKSIVNYNINSEKDEKCAQSTIVCEEFIRDGLKEIGKLGMSVDINQLCEFLKIDLSYSNYIRNMLDNAQWAEKDLENFKRNRYRYKNNFNQLENKIFNNKGSQKDDFASWLIKTQGIAPTTCRSYLSSISLSEKFAKMHHLQHNRLYNVSYKDAKDTYDELFSHSIFIEYNKRSHNQLRAGLNKLLLFLSSNINEPIMQNSIDEEFKGRLKTILNEKFKKGYRLGSPIELRKFKKFWVSEYSEELKYSDDKIEQYIKCCGVVHEEKLYTTQSMASADLQVKLISYIKDSFDSGKSALYYKAIFNEFSELFLDYCMYSADMLKAYLAYINDGSYYINRSYIAKDAYTNADPTEEIRTCLIEKFAPMTYEEIFDVLSHIPEQKIRQILAFNDDFISNSRGQYFHVSIATLSDDELEDIANIIQFSIDEKRFISGNELVDSIKQKYPYIIEQNTLLSDKGLRDAIGYKLKNRFSFKGNIISSQGQSLSMMDVFADFCKHKNTFTLDELKVFKQELDTIIYFDAVYENSLRISKNEFVSQNQVAFQLEETDKAIDRFCTDDYISVGKIEQFGLFPDAGFIWNSFLLEHYVAMYSPNYKLVHSNYNENVCVGGIVKKLSDIDTFDELITDVLAKSGLPLQKEKALQYLCDEGYLARRNYSGIEQILIKAKELRNQKGL